MLYNGEQIGDGRPPLVDVAVDPIDGTRLTAMGRNGALAVIALAERGTMFNPGPCFLHEEDRRRPREVAAPLTSTRRQPTTCENCPSASTSPSRRWASSFSIDLVTTTSSPKYARRVRASCRSPTAMSRAPSQLAGQLGRRHPARHRRHARRRHRRCCTQGPWRRDPRRAARGQR